MPQAELLRDKHMKSVIDRLAFLPLLLVLLPLPAAAASVPDAWLDAKLAQESATTPLSANDIALLTRSAQHGVDRLQESAQASKQAVIAYAKAFVQSLDAPDSANLPAAPGSSHQRLVIALQIAERRNASFARPATVPTEP